MNILKLSVAAIAIVSLPLGVVAQGNGNGNGNGKKNGQAAQSNGNENRGNGNGNRGNGNGNSNAERGQNGNGNGNRGNGNGNGNGNNGNRSNAGSSDGTAVIQRADRNTANPGNVFNCPPGLAKKNPPCVPPGLARQGVTFDQWTNYSNDDIAGLIDDADDFLTDIDVGDDTLLLYPQTDIVTLYDLDPAPEGQYYTVIDGNVVQINQSSYDIVRQLRGYATPVDLRDGLAIAPTAVLSEDELVAIYGLDPATDDRRYTVVDGDLVALPTEAYDLLQLLRYTAAIL